MANNSISSRTRAAFEKEAKVHGVRVTGIRKDRGYLVVGATFAETQMGRGKAVLYDLPQDTRRAHRDFVRAIKQDFAPAG